MKIYKLEDKNSFLTYANDSDVGRFHRSFIGKSMINDWDPIWIEEVKINSKKYDACTFGSHPLFNEKAVEALRDLMAGKVEILPYLHKSEKYFAINVINMTDCLDIPNSDVVIDKKYNFIKDIRRFSFIETLVADETIFKIPQRKGTLTLVTDRFRDRVIEAKLTGFEFWELWDSEAQPIEDAVNPLVFKGLAYTYQEAVNLVIKQGKTLASDIWVLQIHRNTLYLGSFEKSGTFTWIDPVYIPPILLDMEWYVIEPLDIPEEV